MLWNDKATDIFLYDLTFSVDKLSTLFLKTFLVSFEAYGPSHCGHCQQGRTRSLGEKG